MKIVTIVGIRKSGKTSTVTALVEELHRRGKKVGTCKTIFCPTFSIDKPDSNTARHMKAGSGLVCARAKRETSLILPEALPLSRVLSFYTGYDYVLLEGDYLSPVARLVAAHKPEDALQRTNDLTLAYVGRISNDHEKGLPRPVFSALTDIAALADFLEANLSDTVVTEALDHPLPPVNGVTDDGFCQCGCHHHQHKAQQDSVQVTVDGKPLKLTAEQQALLRQWAGEAEE